MAALVPGPGELALFAAAVAVLNATPGVDFLLTVTRTLQGGARAGVAAALGIAAGCVVHALAAASGLSLPRDRSSETRSQSDDRSASEGPRAAAAAPPASSAPKSGPPTPTSTACCIAT